MKRLPKRHYRGAPVQVRPRRSFQGTGSQHTDSLRDNMSATRAWGWDTSWLTSVRRGPFLSNLLLGELYMLLGTFRLSVQSADINLRFIGSFFIQLILLNTMLVPRWLILGRFTLLFQISCINLKSLLFPNNIFLSTSQKFETANPSIISLCNDRTSDRHVKP